MRFTPREISGYFVLALPLLGCGVSVETAGPISKLDLILESKRAEFNAPALAAVIVADGKVVGVSAVGVRKLGENVSVGVADKFHIGSNTKAMTAVLCALLVKAKKLSWDTKAASVLTELEFPAELKEMTLQQLLTHRAGVTPNVFVGARKDGETMHEWRTRYARAALAAKAAGASGEKFEYSNAGYVIAALMAERVTGKDWEDLMREKVFEPLELKSAGFGPPGDAAKIEQPWPHSVRSGRPSPGPFIDNPAVLGPAGTVHMSAEDYGKWMLFLLKHGPKLLSDEEIDSLFIAPPGSEYAFGWARVNRDWGGGEVFTHAGSNTLNFCVAWIAPRKDFSVAVFTNVGGEIGERVTDAVAAKIVTNMHEWRGG